MPAYQLNIPCGVTGHRIAGQRPLIWSATGKAIFPILLWWLRSRCRTALHHWHLVQVILIVCTILRFMNWCVRLRKLGRRMLLRHWKHLSKGNGWRIFLISLWICLCNGGYDCAGAAERDYVPYQEQGHQYWTYGAEVLVCVGIPLPY